MVLIFIPLLLWNNSLVSIYVHSLIPILSFLTTILLIYTAWWSYKNHRDVFKPWLIFALGMLFYSAANLLYFIFEYLIGTPYSPSIADAFFMVAYPLLIVGLLLFLKKPFKIRSKSLLDLAIVMISAFFIVWFPFVWPTVEPSQPDTISMIMSISYLFLDLLALFVLLTLLFNQNKKISELPLALLSAGIFFQIFGDITYAYYVVNPSLVYGWLFNILYASNLIFIALAAVSFLKNINIDLGYFLSSYRRSSTQNDLISYLPLMLVLFTYSLLIITTPDEALIWGVGIVVFMVILRQIASLNEIKKHKESILQKKEQLSFITTNMMDLITESDENHIFQYVSSSCSQVLSYSPEYLLGKSFYSLIHPENIQTITMRLEKAVASQGSVRLQYRCKNAEGKYIWLETIGKPVFEGEVHKGFIYSSRDITEQIKSAEFVKNSLEEKETLLREIHHRVNNNLQIIMSLLNIQSLHVVDKKDQELFLESQSRVRAMAMIHEKLYQSHNLSSIDFSDYLKFLLNHLIYDYSKSLSQIDLDLDIGEIDLNIETSIPCGLIINELVSNSLKYNSSGKITVKMHRENDEYVLRVGDEGAGYLAKTDVTNNPLGLNLVHMLVGQLEGHMEILEEKGTVYQIRFQELKYEERFKT